MTKRLYVGNLSKEMTASELTALLAEAGEISAVRIITNRATGQSKGFAFVEMEQGGDEAIAVFNGRNHNGRALTVIDARQSLYVVTPVKNTSLL
jgi:hypothetical protein